MRIGRNMRAFLNHIRSEPGEWSTTDLASDFEISPSSARRTLRRLESLGMVRRLPGRAPLRGGRAPSVWIPSE